MTMKTNIEHLVCCNHKVVKYANVEAIPMALVR